MNCELQRFKLVLEKAEEPEVKLPMSVGSLKKKEFQKNICFCFIDYAKAFDCVDHNKLWKILKEMGIPDHLTCLLRNLYAVKKQQLEQDMDQRTGSKLEKFSISNNRASDKPHWLRYCHCAKLGYKLEKEYVKAVYCHPAYLTYVQSTS